MSNLRPRGQSQSTQGFYLACKHLVWGKEQEVAGREWATLWLQCGRTTLSTAVKQSPFASVAASLIGWEPPKPHSWNEIWILYAIYYRFFKKKNQAFR